MELYLHMAMRLLVHTSAAQLIKVKTTPLFQEQLWAVHYQYCQTKILSKSTCKQTAGSKGSNRQAHCNCNRDLVGLLT